LLFEIERTKNFREIAFSETLSANNVSLGKPPQSLMNGIRFTNLFHHLILFGRMRVLMRLLAEPMLPAEIPAKIASRPL